MSWWTALLLLAAPAMDDATIYRMAGGPAELRSLLRHTAVEDPATLRVVRRVGTPAGCAALYRAERRLGGRYEAAFRAPLIAAMRHQVPAIVLERERDAANTGLVANPALAGHRAKVAGEVTRSAAAVIAAATTDFKRLMAAELAHPLRLPREAHSWSERRPGSLEGACLFYVSQHHDAVFAGLPPGAS